MVMLAHAANLVTLFLGIETMSLGVYVLTGCWRRSRALRRRDEVLPDRRVRDRLPALRHGAALRRDRHATLSLRRASPRKATGDPGLAVRLGAFLLVVAFGFKVAAVPFHMWAPDAYEGAPTPVTGVHGRGA